MTISISIGSDPIDLSNIEQLKSLADQTDNQELKDWLDNIHNILTNKNYFLNSSLVS